MTFFSVLLQEANASVTTCPDGQYLVRAHKRSGYYRSNKTYVSPARISAYCKNYRNFKPAKLNFSKPQSSRSKIKNFSKKEIKQIQLSFKELPGILTKFGKITFQRKKSGVIPNNPAVSNTSKKTIILHDSISRYNMKRVIAHELAHFLYDSLPSKVKKSYKSVAEWELRTYKGNKFNVFMRKTFVAADSIVSPSEDFANNIEYYLFEGKILKKKNPQIYKWVKQFMEENKK